jgi:hypothetical protein
MSHLPARNRVIYQSEALFISPDTTGNHIYYLPPKNVKNATNLDECMVTGSGDGGAIATFDACIGTGFSAGGANVDKRYCTFSCTGTDMVGNSTNGTHPVLHSLGMKSGIKGGGLDYLKVNVGANSDDSTFGTAVEQLKRVQSANYSFTINRQDINQFGHLARLDSVVLEAPTVSMDFSYYLTDLENERLMGMVTDSSFQSLSGMMTRSQNEFGNNYFILTVPEGRDAVKGDKLVGDDHKTVISVGNGYVTDYSIEASVGAFPTASVTVEGMNIKSDLTSEFNAIPAIDPTDGSLICDRCFFLPPTESGQGESVLKPGDITIDLQDAGLISRQLSGNTVGYNKPEDNGSAHIQSMTLSTPMGRTSLQRLGSTYAYAKAVDFPVTCTLTVNALVADLKSGNLVDLICGGTYDLKVRMQNPACQKCDPNQEPDAVVIDFRKAVLDSESFSSAIGDNKTVDLTFSTQIGGPEEDSVGVFMSGFENAKGADGLHKSFPTVKEGTGEFSPSTSDKCLRYQKYGTIGTTGWYGAGDASGWDPESSLRRKSF